MISLNQFKPQRDDSAWNQSSKKDHFFVWIFTDDSTCDGKVTCAHWIKYTLPSDLDIILHRRRKRFVCCKHTFQICFLGKGGFRFVKRKQWLIGHKFDQAIQDPFIVSLASTTPIVVKQCSK